MQLTRRREKESSGRRHKVHKSVAAPTGLELFFLLLPPSLVYDQPEILLLLFLKGNGVGGLGDLAALYSVSEVS